MRNNIFTHIVILTTIIALVMFSGCTQNYEENNKDMQTPTPDLTPDSNPTGTMASDDSEFIYRNATVENIQILILESFPVQINVVAKGYLPDGCTKIDQTIKNREGNTFLITITTKRPVDAMCTMAIVPFEEVISLDVYGLEAGDYEVNVNGIMDSFTLEMDNSFPD
jgi:inhibitor of cysteine peptidase